MTSQPLTADLTRRAPAAGGFNLTLLRLEIRRLLRNRRTVLFTMVLPVFFFLLFGLNSDYANKPYGSGNVSADVLINLALYGAPPATRGYPLNLRMGVRSNLKPLYRSDATYFERLHWEGAIDLFPEDRVEPAGDRFRG